MSHYCSADVRRWHISAVIKLYLRSVVQKAIGASVDFTVAEGCICALVGCVGVGDKMYANKNPEQSPGFS